MCVVRGEGGFLTGFPFHSLSKITLSLGKWILNGFSCEGRGIRCWIIPGSECLHTFDYSAAHLGCKSTGTGKCGPFEKAECWAVFGLVTRGAHWM